MTSGEFHNIYLELIEENPLAVRAVLKVLRIEFTNSVPTLAMTCERQPRLLVNLAFVREHCRTEAHVKAVICHEFLHVLLRHTERFTTLTPAEHLAVDAVINAIIHRSLGETYSGMMSAYYRGEQGVARLLRPPTDAERERFDDARWGRSRADEEAVLVAWEGLYDGLLGRDVGAGDLLAQLLPNLRGAPAGVLALQTHDHRLDRLRQPIRACSAAHTDAAWGVLRVRCIRSLVHSGHMGDAPSTGRRNNNLSTAAAT